ncbi:MAG: hypothetical protein Q8P42_10435 [Gallionella sp.]|nr:hypothetical protein [Gallionella sp.]
MATPAAGFQSLPAPLAVAGHARFFISWLLRIAPDTHQDQASGDEAKHSRSMMRAVSRSFSVEMSE